MEARKGCCLLGKPRRRGKYGTGSPAGPAPWVTSPAQSGGIPKRNTGCPSLKEAWSGAGIYVSLGLYGVGCSH